MPRHAPKLECSIEDKASLVALVKSRTVEARAIERARIILACLEGSASGSRTEDLRSFRYQMARALLAVGAERTTRPVATGQAGQV